MSTYVFRKPKRPVTKVFIHCSASDNPEHDNVATMDLWHRQRGWAGVGYHLFIRKSGELEVGRDMEKVPAAQEGHNVGSIAICLHGLAKTKFTDAQFKTLKALCQQIDAAYIANPLTYHGHCEVAAKACPVFDYKTVLGLSENGRLPQIKSVGALIEQPVVRGISDLESPDMRETVLSIGAKSSAVLALQGQLDDLGYFVGKLDGGFGNRTRDAVLAFQADNHLNTDGKVGALTREALRNAAPRPVGGARAVASLASLADAGSVVASATKSTGAAGIALSAGGVLSLLESTTGILSQLKTSLGGMQGVIADISVPQGVIFGVIGGYVVIKSWLAGRAHVDDYRSGKTA